MKPDPRWRIHLTTIERERMGPALTRQMLKHLRHYEDELTTHRERLGKALGMSQDDHYMPIEVFAREMRDEREDLRALLDAIKYAVPNLDELARMAGFHVETVDGHVRILSRTTAPRPKVKKAATP